jgi:hypothetical protein
VVSIPLCGYLSLLLVERSIDSQYADFRRFQTANDLRFYLENVFPRNTMANAVAGFMDELGVGNCHRTRIDSFARLQDEELSEAYDLLCSVLAPDGDWSYVDWFGARLNEALGSWRYDIRFQFRNDVLIDISVQYVYWGL